MNGGRRAAGGEPRTAECIAGILSCLLLMFSLPEENWWRLIIWLLLGFIIYFSYGRKHSVMAKMRAKEAGR